MTRTIQYIREDQDDFGDDEMRLADQMVALQSDLGAIHALCAGRGETAGKACELVARSGNQVLALRIVEYLKQRGEKLGRSPQRVAVLAVRTCSGLTAEDAQLAMTFLPGNIRKKTREDLSMRGIDVH